MNQEITVRVCCYTFAFLSQYCENGFLYENLAPDLTVVIISLFYTQLYSSKIIKIKPQ